MPAMQDLIGSLQSIKSTSEELSIMAAAAGEALSKQANTIVALTKPSQSGQQAALAVSAAARSLTQTAASIKTLGRTCDNYIKNSLK
ncbi:MAG: hypothetical protein IJ126_00385 [Lachnospiraceae bacterium]|nr:hypothetical protein [Lachnospiraceae bacterium]